MLVCSLPGVDPCRNLAVEEYLLHHGRDEYLLFWRNDNTIVVGRNQNAAEEIDRAYVEAHGIRVVRRISGGGAVYHDLNNLNFSFITARGRRQSMGDFVQPMAEALCAMGIPAEVSGRNDLTVQGCKVSGNAQALGKDRILHHGTLLFDVNLGVLSSCLKVKAEKYQSRATKSVRSRVANLKDFWLPGAGVADFMAELQRRLSPENTCTLLALTPEQEAAVTALAKDKYASWEWTYGTAPRFTLRRLRKYDGGILEVCLDVRGGSIRTCSLYGDFMALYGVEPVAKALVGVAYRPEDVGRVLDGFCLEEYFGSLCREELLDCFFGDEPAPPLPAPPLPAQEPVA